MSLNINGYKLPKLSLTELVHFNESIKEDILNIIKKKYYQYTSYKYITLVDDIVVNDLSEVNYLYEKFKPYGLKWLVECDLQDRINDIKVKNSRDPEVDFDVEITYIPIKGKILALIHTEQREVIDYWKSLPQVKDYHYQNSVDKPKDITRKQWNKRLSDWELGLGKEFDQTKYGLKYTVVKNLTSYLRLPSFNIMLENQPSYEDRLTRLVEKHFIQRYFEDISLNMDEDEKKASTLTIYQQAINMLRSDDPVVKKLLTEYELFYKNHLIENLTVDILEEKNKL